MGQMVVTYILRFDSDKSLIIDNDFQTRELEREKTDRLNFRVFFSRKLLINTDDADD
jgi:hypothetical protein